MIKRHIITSIKNINIFIIICFLLSNCGRFDPDYLSVTVINNTHDVIYVIEKNKSFSEHEFIVNAGERNGISITVDGKEKLSDKLEYIKILDKDRNEKLNFAGTEMDNVFLYKGEDAGVYKYELTITVEMLYPETL